MLLPTTGGRSAATVEDLTLAGTQNLTGSVAQSGDLFGRAEHDRRLAGTERFARIRVVRPAVVLGDREHGHAEALAHARLAQRRTELGRLVAEPHLLDAI